MKNENNCNNKNNVMKIKINKKLVINNEIKFKENQKINRKVEFIIEDEVKDIYLIQLFIFI